MNIDAASSYLTAIQRPQTTASVQDKTEAASVALTASSKESESNATGIPRTDFTSMTRQEMRDWLNDQIRSGNLSLDDSTPFMAMTMKIPVGGTGEVPADGDDTQYDFLQKVRDGIEGARSRGDQAALEQLKKTMSIMQRYQGQTSGVDVYA